MKFLVCVALLALASASKEHATNINSAFEQALKKYRPEDHERLLKRGENDAEMKDRLQNFRESTQTVEACNDDHTTQFSCHTNHISVMTHAEKEALKDLNANITEAMVAKRSSYRAKRDHEEVPDSWDWLSKGAQGPVKNQGSCGSCWAFAGVSSLEGEYYIQTGELMAFSEQEYVDCTMEHFYNKWGSDWAKDHSGCDGAWMNWAWDYSIDAGRMASQKDFSYVGQDRTCNMDGVDDSMTKMVVTKTVEVAANAAALQEAAYHHIVSVAIKVVNNFFAYREGIYSCSGDCDCSVSLNHAVTIVGYESTYWNVRNSWGSNWGDGGYIKMTRTQDNICNIQNWAMYPAMECKEGQTCEGYKDDSDDGDDHDDEEHEEWEGGEEVECGDLEHFGGLCVDIGDGADKPAVLSNTCDRKVCLTSNGYLVDDASKLCISKSEESDEVQFATCCAEKSTKWNMEGGMLSVGSTCLNTANNDVNPADDSALVVGSCKGDGAQFSFASLACWEELSSKKMGKKIKKDGKAIKTKNLDKAKDWCLNMDSCTGIYSKNGKMFLSSAKKVKDSKKSTDKVFRVVDCEESCDSGTMRCEDGECRSQCEEDDDTCPDGTTLCDDGVCKHEHMC